MSVKRISDNRSIKRFEIKCSKNVYINPDSLKAAEMVVKQGTVYPKYIIDFLKKLKPKEFDGYIYEYYDIILDFKTKFKFFDKHGSKIWIPETQHYGQAYGILSE